MSVRDWAQFTTGKVRWSVRPEYRDLLFGPNGLPLDDWLRDGKATVVKHGPHRTVYRIVLPGLDCYLKHYRLHDARAFLRELVRPSKGRMECDRALAVAERGIPTAEPIALGECAVGPVPGDSFLITKTLSESAPLRTFAETVLPTLAGPRQACIRQRLGIALADFVARLHNAGIVHHDFHASNVLLHLDPDDTPRLYLIDLHAVSLGRPLDRKATRANLVMLNRAFTLRTNRAERFRFWRRYRSLRPVVPSARELEAQTHLSSQEFWSSRDRRSLVNNRYYRRLKSESITGHAVTDLAEGELAPLLTDPDAVFSRPDVRLLKDSRSSTVAELELSVGGVLRRVIFKRFRVTAWHDPWTALVRRSPAVRSWVWGHGLRERDLPTPRPLAVFHRVRNGLPCEGYLLTEKVENAVDLREHLTAIMALPEPERRKRLRELLDRIARLVRALHERGLTHRDLKAANVLMAGDEPWLIDLVGVRRPGHLSRRERIHNLARLNASFLDFPRLSRSDRLRFLRVYLQFGFFGRDRWKRWWTAIDEATRAKAARNARRGRVLA